MTTINRPSDSAADQAPRVDPATVSLSGYEIDQLYGPKRVETTAPGDPAVPHERIGLPGIFPFTRGVHETMYRSRLPRRVFFVWNPRPSWKLARTAVSSS